MILIFFITSVSMILIFFSKRDPVRRCSGAVLLLVLVKYDQLTAWWWWTIWFSPSEEARRAPAFLPWSNRYIMPKQSHRHLLFGGKVQMVLMLALCWKIVWLSFC